MIYFNNIIAARREKSVHEQKRNSFVKRDERNLSCGIYFVRLLLLVCCQVIPYFYTFRTRAARVGLGDEDGAVKTEFHPFKSFNFAFFTCMHNKVINFFLPAKHGEISSEFPFKLTETLIIGSAIRY